MTITLITCTYNAEPVLQRTLNCVLKQSYADIEHIIIDGKSKDDTLKMAEQYKATSNIQRTGHKVTIISEPDKGLYDAMNKGISYATGEYLCFLNAGDMLYDENTIRDIAAAVKADGKTYGVIYGETDIVDDNGNFISKRHLQAPKTLNWRSFRHGMLVCHQSFYANTSIAKQTPYNLKYRISADVDWCIRIMKQAEQQGLSNLNTQKVLCRYLAGGMSIKNHRASLMERYETMCEHYGTATTIIMHLRFAVREAMRKLGISLKQTK